ncbi:hypothetical protein B0H10DRAFT_1953472 [Mycena sp. CBHHK59/15]|nr:hypothetical protein B0H10DRAFT_1953472 [Mycena sp. CBHHK59/15]
MHSVTEQPREQQHYIPRCAKKFCPIPSQILQKIEGYLFMIQKSFQVDSVVKETPRIEICDVLCRRYFPIWYSRSLKLPSVKLRLSAAASKDKIYSGFLTMKGFDPTKDTPVEILHTILLGIVKYIWHISHTPWSAEQKQRYSVRLQATETDGLSIPPIRANYIMQYAGSLIGRQLKTIAQTNTFHVYDIVSEPKFMAWKATGELAALLWFPEICNLADYQSDLKIAVANVLDIFATIDPSKIITKIKYDLLTHIDDDAVAFGPLVGVATEIYESFNAIFRYCSILSNHLAPSRDIAAQLGDQEGLKHRLTGGWWNCEEDAQWRQAGPGVRHFLQAHPVLQKLLGWSEGIRKNLFSESGQIGPILPNAAKRSK